MPRALKIFLLSVAALAILVVVGVGVLMLVIDPNDYKEDIANEVYKRTGHKLTFDGPLKLNIIPALRISTGGLYLENTPEFGGGHLFAVKSAAVELSSLSLLLGSLEIKEIILYDLNVHLAESLEGNANWRPVPPGAHPVARRLADAAQEQTRRPSIGLDWNVELIKVENAVLTYTDLSGPKGVADKADYSIKLKHLELKHFGLNQDATLELELEVEDAVRRAEFLLRVKAFGRYDQETDKLRLVMSQMFLQAQTADMAQAQSLSGRLEADGKLFGREGSIKLNLFARYFNLDVAAVVSPASTLVRPLSILTLVPDIAADVKMSANIRQLAYDIGHAMSLQGAEALSKFTCDYKLKYTGGLVELSDMKGNLDATTYTGSKSMRITLGETPLYKGVAFVHADSLILDDYLPVQNPAGGAVGQSPAALPELSEPAGYDAKAVQAASPQPFEGAAQTSPLALVAEWLKKLDLSFVMQLDSLTLRGVTAEAIEVKLSGSKNKISLENLECKTLGGTVQSSGSMLVEPAKLAATLNVALSAIDIGKLPVELSSGLTGVFEAEGAFSAQGTDFDELHAALGGKGKFGLRDVEMPHGAGFLPEEALGIFPKLRPLAELGDIKRIDSVSGTFNGSKALFRNNDLLAKGPKLNARGSGTFNAVSTYLDYAISISAAGYTGIPAHVRGPLNNLQYSVDKEKTAVLFGRKVLEQGVGEGVDVLKNLPGSVPFIRAF